jgi:hypothetical protein
MVIEGKRLAAWIFIFSTAIFMLSKQFITCHSQVSSFFTLFFSQEYYCSTINYFYFLLLLKSIVVFAIFYFAWSKLWKKLRLLFSFVPRKCQFFYFLYWIFNRFNSSNPPDKPSKPNPIKPKALNGWK